MNSKAPTQSHHAGADKAGKLPEWIRIPAPGTRCAFTGLSKATLVRLAVPSSHNKFSPPVRSVHLKRPGYIRGRRLVHLASLLKFIDSASVSNSGE